MRIIRKLSIGLPAVLLAAAALCQSLPVANRPEDLGMSSQRLERIRLQMNADIEGGRIPGAVLLIARNGKIAQLDALGFQERKSQTPMRTDSSPADERGHRRRPYSGRRAVDRAQRKDRPARRPRISGAEVTDADEDRFICR